MSKDAAWGGSTEINSGFWHRLPPEFLLRWKARFALEDFSGDLLDRHFDWAEEALHVGLRGEAGWPKSTQVFNRGIQAMDWSAQEVKRAADNCVNTNTCSAGCPKGAKQGVSLSLIPRAESRGVRFLTGCKAKLLLKSGKRITGILAEIKRESGASDLVRIDADHGLCLCRTNSDANPASPQRHQTAHWRFFPNPSDAKSDGFI